MFCLKQLGTVLHNKPKAAVHSVHKLTGAKKKKLGIVGVLQVQIFLIRFLIHCYLPTFRRFHCLLSLYNMDAANSAEILVTVNRHGVIPEDSKLYQQWRQTSNHTILFLFIEVISRANRAFSHKV
jgi:hypothetical protein